MKENSQDALFVEVLKGDRRIGASSRALVAWLLRFSRLDIPTLSEGDLLNLQHEAMAFSLRAVPAVGRGPSLQYVPSIMFVRNSSQFLLFRLTREHLLIFQQDVRRMLEGIAAKGHIDLNIPAGTAHLGHTKETEDGPETWAVVFVSAEPAIGYYYGLLHCLAQHALEIRKCPACSKLFLAGRRNKNFCSSQCQSRVATNRYREKHGLKTGRRRGRPRKTDTSHRGARQKATTPR